jgi:hypothetical protein
MAHSWMAVIQYPSSRQARKFSHKAFFLSSYRLRTYRYDAFSFFQEHHTGVILRQVPTGSLDHLAVDSDQAKVGTTRESWCRGPRGLEWYQPPGPVGTIPTGAVAVGIAYSVATWCPLIHPYFQFEFKYNRLNWKVVIFIVRAPKNPKKIKLHPPSPYKYPHGLRSSHSHTNTFPLSWHTHTMSSSSSSDMEDQIINTFSGCHGSSHEHSCSGGGWFIVDMTTEALRQPWSWSSSFQSATWLLQRWLCVPPSYFRRRNHMRRTLFLSIIYKLS